LTSFSNKQPHRQKQLPQRTCVVCRKKFDKRQLTRIVRTAAEGVVVDSTGKRNGRGAYICHQPLCWEEIEQKKGLLDQALKTAVTTAELKAIANQNPALLLGRDV